MDIDNQYLIVNSDGCISGNDHCIIYPDKNKDWDDNKSNSNLEDIHLPTIYRSATGFSTPVSQTAPD